MRSGKEPGLWARRALRGAVRLHPITRRWEGIETFSATRPIFALYCLPFAGVPFLQGLRSYPLNLIRIMPAKGARKRDFRRWSRLLGDEQK
jgi:hypothetical protein